MTREELLEHRIYCPEKIDKSIIAYFNLGFGILIYAFYTYTLLYRTEDNNCEIYIHKDNVIGSVENIRLGKSNTVWFSYKEKYHLVNYMYANHIEI